MRISILALILGATVTISASAQEVTVGSSSVRNSGLNNQIQSLKTSVQLNQNTTTAITRCGNTGQVADASQNCRDVEEKDPSVKPHAKNTLPTCGTNEVLKATGPNTLTCVSNIYVPMPPVCTGTNKALQWNGSRWSCTTIAASAPAAAPIKTYQATDSCRSVRANASCSTDAKAVCKTGKVVSGSTQCSKGTASASHLSGNGWYGKCGGRGNKTVTVFVKCQ